MTTARSTAVVALAMAGVAALGLELWWLTDGAPQPTSSATVHEPTAGPLADRTVRDSMTGDAPEKVGRTDAPAIVEKPSHRRIRLQFRCQTLGHNVRDVWSHMGLKVQLQDEEGRHLTECPEPWLPSTVSIPADVQRITFVARGYQPLVVESRETFRDGLQPTVLSLEPDARVHLRARNLPSARGNRFGIWARLATGADEPGSRFLHGSAYAGGGEAPRGELVVDIRIPSGVPSMFVVARSSRASDERAGFADLATEVVTLAPGEERNMNLDLVDFGILEGRVTGLPAGSAEHQVLSVLTESGSTQAVVDGEGGFRIVGLTEPARLQLMTQGGPWPALREVSSEKQLWPPNGSYLILEPEEPVHGVVPAMDGRDLGVPFQVQMNCPPDGRQLSHKIPLFTGKLLERSPLFFFVEGFGHFNRSLASEQPDADGLYRVEVSRTAGDLLVRMAEPPGDGLHLFAREVTSGLSITGMPSDDGWRFEGLAAGEYELVVHYARRGFIHSERALAETVMVQPQQQTMVTVQMPGLVEIHGEIQNWSALPVASRPHSMQVHHGGRPHTTRPKEDGTFQVTVIAPWDGVAKIAFFNPHWLTDVQTSNIKNLPGPRLTVRLPDIRERWLTVDPIAGGKLSILAHVGATGTGQHLRPDNGRSFRIAGAPVGVEGILLEEPRENGQSLRLLRGWFRLPDDGPDEIHLAPTGRWIQVTVGRQTTLTVAPPAWWTHPPQPWSQVRLGSGTQRLWLPDGATAVTVNGRSIPVARIGDTLRVDS